MTNRLTAEIDLCRWRHGKQQPATGTSLKQYASRDRRAIAGYQGVGSCLLLLSVRQEGTSIDSMQQVYAMVAASVLSFRHPCHVVPAICREPLHSSISVARSHWSKQIPDACRQVYCSTSSITHSLEPSRPSPEELSLLLLLLLILCLLQATHSPILNAHTPLHPV